MEQGAISVSVFVSLSVCLSLSLSIYLSITITSSTAIAKGMGRLRVPSEIWCGEILQIIKLHHSGEDHMLLLSLHFEQVPLLFLLLSLSHHV